MKTVIICKAEPLANQEPIPVTIIIDGDLPDFEALRKEYKSLDFRELSQYYQDQAELLINALYNSLPQGTFDRLGIEFMKKKVSLYRGVTNG